MKATWVQWRANGVRQGCLGKLGFEKGSNGHAGLEKYTRWKSLIKILDRVRVMDSKSRQSCGRHLGVCWWHFTPFPTSFWSTTPSGSSQPSKVKDVSTQVFSPQARDSFSYPSSSQIVIPQNNSLSWVSLMGSASEIWSFSNCWGKILLENVLWDFEFFFLQILKFFYPISPSLTTKQ